MKSIVLLAFALILSSCSPQPEALAPLVAAHHKTLTWNPAGPEMHVAYYNVYMALPNPNPRWLRLTSTEGNSVILPAGDYTRKFCVSAMPDQTVWPFNESAKSLPLTTHL